MRSILLAGFVATLLAAGPLTARDTSGTQDTSGTLAGRVVDATSGEGVAGASVRASGPVDRELATGPDGSWVVGGVPEGSYTIDVSHLAFAPSQSAASVRDGGTGTEIRTELTPRPVTLESLVVTAGRRLQRLSEAAVATELVSRREIEETGATDLAAVLTERTGLALQGGHPAGSGVMIQGMGSERVLVLVDGQPFIGRISGRIDVSRIPTEMIERIEVVKGPQSTLYGSEAMGGVVNVITRGPGGGGEDWGAATTLTAGDQGRLDLSVSGAGSAGPVAATVDVGRRTIELTPGQSADDGQRSERWDGSARVAWTPSVEGVRFEAGGMFLDERQRWGAGPRGFQFADNAQWSGRLGGTFDRGVHGLSATLYATSFEHLSRRASSEAALSEGERERQRLLKAETLYGAALGDHAVDIGVEAQRERIDSDRVLGGDRDTRTMESFVQTTLNWGRLTVVPGVRGTWSDPWGDHWTPRIAVMYRPIPELALRVSGGEGFRAPAFKELYLEFLNIGPGYGYTVRGNPDLRPEVSRNLTGSVEWAGARTYLRAQAFDNRFDDFIETRAVGDSSGIDVYTYGNIDDGFTRGIELEGGVTQGAWRLEGGYSVLRAERTSTGEPLLGRPQNSARTTVGYSRPGGTRGSVSGVFTGRTPMQRDETGTVWRDGYLRFDARVAQDLPGGLQLVVGVDNLLDRREEERPGFTGRHLYTAVTWRPFGRRDARSAERPLAEPSSEPSRPPNRAESPMNATTREMDR